jgi:hypothetical protein
MSDYDAFVDSIQPDIDIFRRRQAEGVASEEARCVRIVLPEMINGLSSAHREQILLDRWEQRRQAEQEAQAMWHVPKLPHSGELLL